MGVFAGYLLRVNGKTVPNSYIRYSTYSTKPEQIQDQDSYRDGDGFLVRGVLPHRATTINFSLKPMYLYPDMETLRSIIPFSSDERIAFEVTYWNDAKGIYNTGTFYAADPEFNIKSITDDNILYNEAQVEMVEY